MNFRKLSRYAKKQVTGSPYWEQTAGLREVENRACSIRLAERANWAALHGGRNWAQCVGLIS